MKTTRIAVFAVFVVLVGQTVSAAAPADEAQEILKAAGVSGGLVVHLGCGDAPGLTAALRASDAYVVHGLSRDAEAVAGARKAFLAKGVYGPVAVMHWTGKGLPYADNLVNLLVAADLGDVAMDEVRRVLAPGGVAMVAGKKTVKPRPDTIDEWTHHLYGPGGNAVGHDTEVGPPRHLQWTAGPLWARSHGWTPSVSAMVSARGRFFAICDETLACVDGTVPSQWFVVARDAFSGVLLWKHPVPNWDSKDFSGTPGNGAVPRFTMPPQVYKRLVAVDDTVFVTLGAEAPVTALDAATGEEKRTYAETARADEVLVSGGRLIVAINPPASERPEPVAGKEPPPPGKGKQVAAVDIATGRLLWKKGPLTSTRTTKQQDPFGRLELAAGGGGVFALTADAVVAFDAATGETRWQIERPAIPDEAVTRVGYGGVFEFLHRVMLYEDGVVLLAEPEPNTHHTYHTMPGSLYAFDAKDGKRLWKHPYGGWGHCTPPGVFVVGDAVWTHVNAKTEFGSVWGSGFRARDGSKVDYRIQALDLHTGKVRTELGTKPIFNVGHHHRCTRNKITERFLLTTRRGVEFVDLSSGENWQNHWVRTGCLLGYLPCNGLLYVSPHPCACYIEAKLVGFNALAPASAARGPGAEVADDARLVKGPAFGKIANQKSKIESASAWPTHRGNPRRSGVTTAAVPTALKVAWTANVGARPSAPVVAGGRVFVAGVDTHTVHALDEGNGKEVWRYTAGGRVDSPPTVYRGLVLFGSADGRVHCLRADDGALVWRFQAAPRRRLVMAFGQIESAWPVPGSVLVHDGTCWFAAGRSSYLDDGICFWGLDPATGEVKHRETICHRDPKTGKQPFSTNANRLTGLLNDVPATDGASVFIRQMQVASSDGRGGMHLFTSGGYLDPSWFNRTFWMAGKAKTSGVMVLGDDVAYGMEVYKSRSRETVFQPASGAYRLRCVPLKMAPLPKGEQKARRPREPKPQWEQRVDIRVIALVRASDTLFAAGPPDVVDPTDPHGAWEGRKGGVLAAFSTADGKERARLDLPAPPVWDGLAAAGGRLYVALADGRVVCLKKQ